MEEFFIDWVGGMLVDFQESIEIAVEILGQDLKSNVNMWGMVGTMHGIIKPVCYIIMVVFFLIEFIKMTMKMDMIKWENIFKMMMKFVIVKAFVDYGPDLMDLIYSTVAEWTTAYGDTTYDSAMFTGIMEKMNEKLGDLGFWEILGMIATCILHMLVINICAFIVKVIAYGRLIEIYILLACMPIPFAFVLDEHSQITKKYILNFAGVCLQGLLMVLACSLFQYLMADTVKAMGADSSASATDMLFTMCLAAVVLVLSITKCGQWGKQLLNAA